MQSTRSYRYAIEVNGDAEQFSARYDAAVKRAHVIAKTWPNACRVIVRDTWNARPAYIALDIVTGASVEDLTALIAAARADSNWQKHEFLWDMRHAAEVTAREESIAAMDTDTTNTTKLYRDMVAAEAAAAVAAEGDGDPIAAIELFAVSDKAVKRYYNAVGLMRDTWTALPSGDRKSSAETNAEDTEGCLIDELRWLDIAIRTYEMNS